MSLITVNYGIDWAKTTKAALEASDITSYLKTGMAVSIKPNLVTPSPPNNGATTHPEVVEGIIIFLKNYGISDIQIIESSAVGYSTPNAYKSCGYHALEKRYGVALIDLKKSPARNMRSRKFDMDIDISEIALDTDFLINVPVLKAHCQTRLTCCMKNLKGCIPEREMRRFHTLGLHKPIAALSDLLPVHYCVIDGICGDLSFEEGGSPVEANRIIVGHDPILLDSFCGELIGCRPEDVSYLVQARDKGLGEFFSPLSRVLELNADQKPGIQQKSTRISERYRNSGNIEEHSACSVCYASLIHALHRSGGRNNKKFCIGQGFKGYNGKSADSIGIGNCAKGFATYVKGCPPKAVDIMELLMHNSY